MKKLFVLFITLCMAACMKEEEPVTAISETKIELKYDEQHQFVLKYGTLAIDNSRILWKSRDEKVGTIDVSGTFKARKIGKTVITAYTDNGMYQADVEVVTYDRSIQDPVLDFYASQDVIKAKEKGILHRQTSGVLDYSHVIKNLVCSLMYYFENGKMVECHIVYIYSIFNPEITTFFKERYPVMVKDGNVEVYYPDDQPFTVSLTKRNDGVTLIKYKAK